MVLFSFIKKKNGVVFHLVVGGWEFFSEEEEEAARREKIALFCCVHLVQPWGRTSAAGRRWLGGVKRWDALKGQLWVGKDCLGWRLCVPHFSIIHQDHPFFQDKVAYNDLRVKICHARALTVEVAYERVVQWSFKFQPIRFMFVLNLEFTRKNQFDISRELNLLEIKAASRVEWWFMMNH